MMPHERKTSSPAGRGAFDHIDLGPVMAHKVHIDRGEAAQVMTQIGTDAHGLEEHLGKDHRGAQVDVHPAGQAGHQGAKDPKIPVTQRPPSPPHP